ncbi:hypothetical protein ISCGN_026348 [Ixodes scapularis]
MTEELFLNWIKSVWWRRPGALLTQRSMLVLEAFHGHLTEGADYGGPSRATSFSTLENGRFHLKGGVTISEEQRKHIYANTRPAKFPKDTAQILWGSKMLVEKSYRGKLAPKDRKNLGASARKELTPEKVSLILAKLSVVLHADLEGKPCRLEDFRGPLKQVGVLSDVAGLGAYQMSHVWLLKLRTPEAKAKLLQARSLQVKGKTCLPVDPNRRELRVKLHRVSFDAPVDSIRRAFEPFGEVKEVSREKWKVDGFVDVDSTTVVIRLALKEGVALESLPHQLRVSGGNVLVVVPGRAPICLRRRRTRHIRRDCRAPRCTECRAFGDEARDCVKTYARAASSKVNEESTELLMDEDEAEQAATPATSTASVAAAPEGVEEPSDVNAAPVAETTGRAESPDVPSVEASRPGNTAAGTSDVTAPDLSGESSMKDQDSSASGAAPKRMRDDGSGDPNATSQEEPPSKAAPLWRRRLQVKQNIPVKDQKVAQPPP